MSVDYHYEILKIRRPATASRGVIEMLLVIEFAN